MSDVTTVRLLINDTATVEADRMFTDAEVQAFLDLEGGAVKLAAAQAIDTIADNEVLVSKVIKDRNLSTDGAKVADALRKRAAALRTQHDATADDGFFDVIDLTGANPAPELTGHPWFF